MRHILLVLLLIVAAPVVTYAAQATLSWTDGATGEDAWRIERRDGPDTAPWMSQGTVPTGTTTFNQAGLVLGTRYCYRAIAQNAFGSTATAAPEGCATPDVPSGGSTNLTIIFAP